MVFLTQFLKSLVIVVSVFGMWVIFSPTASAEVERGQALYENHCKVCHESWVHTRNGSKVTSKDDLKQRVSAWSVHSGLDWKKEEVDDVSDYLNQNFYHIE